MVRNIKPTFFLIIHLALLSPTLVLGAYSYTKVCNTGEVEGSGSCPSNPSLGLGENDWGCTKDNSTGLIWEVKVNDVVGGSIRDRDFVYDWNSSASLGSAQYFTNQVNTLSTPLCGSRAWRLPTKNELKGLVYCSNGAQTPLNDDESCSLYDNFDTPTITINYFPNTPIINIGFWTSTEYISNEAWAVYFLYGVATGSPTNQEHAVRLVSTPATLYQLTTNVVGSGSITSSPSGIDCGSDCSQSYAENTEVTLTATADNGSVFTGWSGECSGNGTCVITMNSTKSVTANFTLSPVNGSCGTSDGGTFTTAPSTNLCSTGTDSDFSGTGPWTWTCLGENSGTNASCSADIRTYAITALSSPTAGGSVNCTPNPVNHGANSTCTATPNSGYNFNFWDGDCSGTSSSCLISNVTSTKSVTANFTLPLVEAACGTSDGGTFISAPSTNLCSSGSSSSVSGTGPWSWSCQGSNGGSNANCSAYIQTYSITETASPSEAGSVDCSPNPVNHGSDSTCTAVVNAGYEFTSWNEDCSGTDLTCLLNNVTSSKSVIANFSSTSPPINGSCGCSNAGAFSKMPSTSLCSSGIATSVTSDSVWSWSCLGEHGGSDVQCSANILPINEENTASLKWNTFFGGSGSEYGNAIAIDNSDNVYIVGHTTASWGTPINEYSGGIDILVAKFNKNGALLWHTYAGTTGTDFSKSITIDDSANLYVTGYVNGSTDVLIKINSSGEIVWTKNQGGDGDQWITIDNVGNIYTLGKSGFVVSKFNNSGVLQWRNSYGSGSGSSIGNDGIGNIYVTGYSSSSWGNPINAHTASSINLPNNNDIVVFKLDTSGQLLWNTFHGGSGGDTSSSISVSASGNVIVAGNTPNSWGIPINGKNATSDFSIFKLNTEGILQWNTFHGGCSYDENPQLSLDSSENIYVTGKSYNIWGDPVNPHSGASLNNYDIAVFKLFSNGKIHWNSFYGSFHDNPSQDTDEGRGIKLDSTGRIYVTGFSNGTWGNPLNAYSGSSDLVLFSLISGLDSDNDGYNDSLDNCPNDPNADQADLDGDNTGDACDPDIDGDGINNPDDAYPVISIGNLPDNDNDGAPDDCDTACLATGMTADSDDDNDGYSDQEELDAGTSPTDPNDFPIRSKAWKAIIPLILNQ